MISNFQDIPTFTSLKSHLLSLIRPKIKSTFGIHDALGLRYLFQLRVNLSPLRSHKMRHNFSDTPSENSECNLGIEDIRHFLFGMPLLCNSQSDRSSLSHIGNRPELYLYGHLSLDLIDNRQILLSTIQYVKGLFSGLSEYSWLGLWKCMQNECHHQWPHKRY